jgi:hypothetical protein
MCPENRRLGLFSTRQTRGSDLTTAEIAAASGRSDYEHGRQLRRALIASTVGTTIEWYDFLL